MKEKVIVSKISTEVYKIASSTYPGISGIGFSVEEAKIDFKFSVCEIFGISKDRADGIELEVQNAVL